MTVVRWDPLRNIATLQDRINRLFSDAFPQPDGGEEDLSVCAWRPLVDIYEEDQGIVIQADLPGVNKEDVSVEVKDNLLTIQGLRQVDSEASDEQYYRRERTCGTFQRAFTLRYSISPEAINASFKNGVLKIRIPSPKEEKPKQVTVNIE